MKYTNIAISGLAGTGKTTLANNLAKKLGWKHVNNGEVIREWFKRNNLKLEETERIPESLDRQIDDDFSRKMQTEENAIFESRLAGWLARNYKWTFKVLCTASGEERAKRVGKREGLEVGEAGEKSAERDEGLRQKFLKLYGATDYLEPKYFNLVVDTTELTPDQILQLVVKSLEK